MTADPHITVFMGAGVRCTRCNAAWDIDDEAPETCVAEPADASFLNGGPAAATPTNWHFASGDAEFLKDDMGGRRFFPITETAHITSPGVAAAIMESGHHATPAPRPSAMVGQVGGSHYKLLAIQPTEFCQRNGLDFCIGSILKYLTRHRSKNGAEDLCKARHFVEIRESFPQDIRPPRQIAITMAEYVAGNNIGPEDAEALYRLEAYYNDPTPTHAGDLSIGARRLIEAIDRLLAAQFQSQ